MRSRFLGAAALTALTLLGPGLPVAQASDEEFTLVIKDHRFEPVELEVLAGRKLRLVVENRDPTPEEFESYDLNREKIISANGRVVIFVGPLKPGRYEFIGEFNMATARGSLIAR